jgi:lipopolysaccharide exporter
MRAEEAAKSLHVAPEAESWSSRIGKGLFWSTAGVGALRITNLLSAILLARLLAPTDFGLMAVALAVISFSQGASQTGFQSALVQTQDKPEELLNIAWSYELVRYLVLSVILFAAAPLLASFFHEVNVTPILRVLSVSFAIQGLNNVGIVYLRKNLEFNKQFVLDVVPSLASLSLAIAAAFILRNVWALVWAQVGFAVVMCLMSYAIHPYRPRLDFDPAKARRLFGFGKWILAQSILVIMLDQAVTMFIGKFLGMARLGFYNRAGAFSTTMFQQLNDIIWKVFYPVFAKLQNDLEVFRKTYQGALEILVFVGLPASSLLFVLSGDFVHVLLTDKWLPIVPVMRIFCVQAFFIFVGTPAMIAYQACGRPGVVTKASFCGLIITAISIFPMAARWGVSGAAAGVLAGNVSIAATMWFLGCNLMGIRLFAPVKSFIFVLLNSGFMIFAVVCLRTYIVQPHHISSLFVLGISGPLLYAGISLLIEKFIRPGLFGESLTILAGRLQSLLPGTRRGKFPAGHEGQRTMDSEHF